VLLQYVIDSRGCLVIDIAGYLQSVGVIVTTSGKNCTEGWTNTRCVFCDDTSNHLGINNSSGVFKCWRCGRQGPFRLLIKKLSGLSEREALDLEAIFSFGNLVTTKGEVRTYGNLPPIEKFSDAILHAPKDVESYLQGRGLSLLDMHTRAPGSMYSKGLGPLPFRVIIPIIQNTQIVNYVGRDYTGLSSRRYLALPDSHALMNIKESLYGIDYIEQRGNIILVEGVFDQIKLGIGSVATFGIFLTGKQLELLRSKHPNKVFILLDKTASEDGTAERMARDIWFSRTTVLSLNTYADPGEISLEEGRKLMMELADV